ncbi:hypothetical protein CEY12_10330 [Chryseobacterium sp. T16E-39]|uniref:hypothetical protein n=1 Tax=Chryseobacterium sp. T16E-39 TaxID=2015076 RepID=UPI000B5B180B|nr:hypothetical protein [Chryseobacterium sp. T16E-39]ASK30480.1 hypothetical protein CEY12_10330 [Chryseobacterium sp. T16E-39]
MKNYIKKALPTVLSFLSISFYAQDYNSLFSSKGAGDGTDAFNIVPPSPESFFRTQFGNLNFNEFKGSPNIQIPIYEIKDGILKLPVTLNYSKAGVKVNDIPNSTGMNWLLDTGGIITRTIYDLADEAASQRLVLNSTELGNLSSQAGAQDLGVYSHDISTSIDNEIDVFNYSIPGYSGSFYLDKNFNPVLLTQDYNLKIEAVDNNFKVSKSFIITTYNGTKYTFGGVGATERTWVRLQGTRTGITSFYLKTIEDLSHNKIEFTYNQVSSKIIPLGEQETGLLQALDFPYVDAGSGQTYTTNAPSTSAIGTSGKVLNIAESKFLDKITAGNEVIQFNYITEANSPFQKIGNIVISQNGVNAKKITFDYINSSGTTVSEKRFFLTSVKEYAVKNNADTFISEYALDYNNALDLPKRLSRSVDYLGYYNGKNNTALLPNLKLFGEQYPIFNSNTNYADRRPNFDYAKLGTLRSITYPTKGKTMFEYESIQAKVPINYIGDCVIGNTNYVNLPYVDQNDWLPLTNESTFTHYVSTIDGNTTNAQITLMLHSDKEINQPNKANALFEITDLATNQVIFSKTITVIKMIQDITNTYTVPLANNKSYKFNFKVKDICYECNGNAHIEYPNVWQKVEDSNIRLKRQYDVSETGTINIKRLYYTTYQNINSFDALAAPLHPQFKSYSYNQVMGQNAPTHAELGFASTYETLFHSDMQSSRIHSIQQDGEDTLFDINDPVYPQVTISYGGDNFEKGGEEKTFDMKAYTVPNAFGLRLPNAQGMAPNSQVDNTSALNLLISTAENTLYKQLPLGNIQGKLISHRIFNNKNGSLFVKNSIENEYNAIMGNNAVYSLAGIKLYPYVVLPPGVDESTSLDNFYIGQYRFPTYSAFPSTTKTTEYLEDVPVSVTDDSLYKKLTTTTNFTYDSLDKQLSKNTVLNSDASIQEITYLYAREKNNQKLINANMIGIPLETKVVEKQNAGDAGKVVSRTETMYDTLNSYLPSSVLSDNILNSTPSTDITYDWYDPKGHLLQYTPKSGIPVTIIWGYKSSQPIAKIEGIDYRSLSGVAQTYITQIMNASDADAVDPTKEGDLLTALDAFRKNPDLSAYQISTYTYDPLIGLTSITPPSGIREVYVYDSANRLVEIRQGSKTGNILKEFKYNYKN